MYPSHSHSDIAANSVMIIIFLYDNMVVHPVIEGILLDYSTVAAAASQRLACYVFDNMQCSEQL